MVATVWSAVLQGVSAKRVRIEASSSPGLPQVRIVGMPATDVKESLDRVRQALRSVGVVLPARRIVVNLFPASLRKTGSQLDLPIAIALMCIAGVSISVFKRDQALFCLGELGLDGSVYAVNGLLPMTLSAEIERRFTVLLPQSARSQLFYQPKQPVVMIHHLQQLRESVSLPTWSGWGVSMASDRPCKGCVAASNPFENVRGQVLAKRVLQIAVAGGHHVLLIGPPGCGKSYLAQNATQILPRIPLLAAQELLTVQSICGDPMRVCDVCGSVQAPVRAPHHSVTTPVLIGGGVKVRPGEISRAHNGVLLLDEIGEMKRSVAESLRQPLQDGRVTIARHLDRVTLPARCQLIATMNPCPCGWNGSTMKSCDCSQAMREKYQSFIRGPLGDRFDAIVRMESVHTDEYIRDRSGVSDDATLQSIATAVTVQRKRRIKNAWLTEAHRSSVLELSKSDQDWLVIASKQLCVTTRGMLSVLRLARTVADMSNIEQIKREHLAEALQLRREP